MSFFVSLGIGLTALLVLFVLGSMIGGPPDEDDEEEDDTDGTDIYTPQNVEEYGP